MRILDLHDANADFFGAGGKAAGLNRLAREGFNVPKGFVLVGATEEALNQAADFFDSFGMAKVAVRSSASAEDGADFSSAGQYATSLNVVGRNQFAEAVSSCIASLKSATATSYGGYFSDARSDSMSVVVQQMVDAELAGVCFTVSPTDKNCLLVEAVEGLGEALVSGAATSHRYEIPRSVLESDSPKEGLAALKLDDFLSLDLLLQLCVEALRAEKAFGHPLDTEWAVEGGELFWLQARPITALEDDDLGELDPKYSMDGLTITRCNIGEMLPGAVTPLTLSTSLYSIDYGMREMLRMSGVYKSVDDMPEYYCALSASNHLFINISSTYTMDGTVFGASRIQIDNALCGRPLDTPFVNPLKYGFFKRLSNGGKYFRFLLSSKKAIKELTVMAEQTSVGESASTPQELYAQIDANKWKNDRAMLLHYVTSSYSGAMSSAMIEVLKSKLSSDFAAKEAVAELLENIDDIESVDILRSLRALARAVLKDNPSAKELSAEQLARYLESASGEVATAHEAFLHRHGHRAIREAEMRNKGWADDQTALTEYLKTVLSGSLDEAQREDTFDVKQAVKKYKEVKGLTRGILVYLTKNARAGVVKRELSKSRIVKIWDSFKRAYSRLAAMLCMEGALPDEDLIYFLTHQEIGELVNNKNHSLIKKAIRRRRQLGEQSELCFDEVYLGKPVPVELDSVAASAGEKLKGTPISRGVVTGRARIVKSESDARTLEKGDIMVASYTDIGWSPYYCLMGGLVTEVGSALSHGAVVAREYSLPLVSNITGATRLIKNGDTITLDGAKGTVTILQSQAS